MKTGSQAPADSKRLSVKLKELRLSHGYRQEDIAAAIGIKQATYSNYELGRRMPGTSVIYRIANFYGLPTDDLLKFVIPLDDDIYFDAPGRSAAAREEHEFLKYINSEKNEPLSRQEKELLYHFKRLTTDGRQEVLDFAEFRRGKERRLFSEGKS